jgi:thiol-disulfide isomerase/thioredoxin
MKYIYLFLSLLVFANCNGQKGNNAEANGAAKKPAEFQLPTIPNLLMQPEARAAYLVQHYWDNFDFSDTAYIHLPDISEQAFVDYIDVLPYVPLPIASESIKDMLKQAEADKKVYHYFTDLCEKYLYDANSPMRNDEFYIPVLEAELASPLTEEKVRPADLLQMAKKNRVGQSATNFSYTLANGQKGALHTLKSPYTLLFFYNPGCHNCQEVTQQLQASPVIDSFLKNHTLTVLAVYTDEDLQAWRDYLPKMPKEWTIVYDDKKAIHGDDLYDLKAIPSLYLLDGDQKTVVLKDVGFAQVEDFFKNKLAEK